MSNRYDDIIDLPHYVSKSRKPMPPESRAAQFASFAALSGHEEAIEEAAVRNVARMEGEEEIGSIP